MNGKEKGPFFSLPQNEKEIKKVSDGGIQRDAKGKEERYGMAGLRG